MFYLCVLYWSMIYIETGWTWGGQFAGGGIGAGTAASDISSVLQLWWEEGFVQSKSMQV